jgi:hypothetical protein
MIWHYTEGKTLPAILKSGVLKPQTVSDPLPAVWFSLRKDWDPAVGMGQQAPKKVRLEAAAKFHGGGMKAVMEHLDKAAGPYTAEDMGGLARIGVAPETAPFTFADYAKRAGMTPHDIWARTAIDKEAGSNPSDWRVSFDPVPASKWLVIQTRSGTRRGERWERHPYSRLAEALGQARGHKDTPGSP